ncbi:DUF4215 domain-containing protein [Candidatus Woesearchaeota archaeon]|nr:DUF4215 domain-containing protein [Candidatus Woesearchaeota archaeon]
MKRRITKVYKKLPPHTNEAHPVANAGEASKPLVIGIIAIVAVVALSLLLLFSNQFVGKALFTGQETNAAGAELIPANVYENQPFSLKVRANTGVEVSVVGFELDLPLGVSCDKVTIKNMLGWDVESKKKCENNKITFEYATFGAGKSGTFDVAQLDILGVSKGDYNFKFASFQAFDSSNKNAIVTLLDPAIQVKEQQQQQQPVCGDGKVEGIEQCDGTNLAGSSCNAKGFDGGSLYCDNACKFDTSKCNVQLCGNSKIDSGETCDDGNTNDDDGCDTDCNVDTVNGWECSGQPSVCKLKVQPVCGNGKAEAYEECDGTDFGGSATECSVKGLGTGIISCTTGCKFDFSKCVTQSPSKCGDGKINYDSSLKESDECDDGNLVNGDGCSSTCKEESSWQCSGEPSVCKLTVQQVCGNNIKEGTEVCDGSQLDGKTCEDSNIFKSGTLKCNPDCKNFDYSSCKMAPPSATCGNGIEEGAETCDDGNTVTGDGCSSTCQTEQQQTPPSTTGTKITLTNADTENDFATTITATEAFTTEVTVYTVLYGANDKVLSIKSEKIEGGLTKLQTYTATVNYAKANVKKKSVLVFDKKPGVEVSGQLVKEY